MASGSGVITAYQPPLIVLPYPYSNRPFILNDTNPHFSYDFRSMIYQEKVFHITAREISAPGNLSVWVELSTERVGGKIVGNKREAPPDGLGDVNGDGWVDSTDVGLIQQHLATLIILTSEQRRRADVDGNGVINIVDVLMVSYYILGRIDIFPASALVLRPARLGDVTVIVATGVIGTVQTLRIPFTVTSNYCRVGVSAVAVSATSFWEVLVAIEAKR